MLYTLSHKTKQFFFVLIKTGIVICVFYFIYQKLFINSNLNFDDFNTFLSENSIFSLKNIFFLLFLTILNWFFEILKWHNLISHIKSISFFEAFKQTLAAHTIAILTPNRIGEYGAKALYYNIEQQKKVLLLNGESNVTQLMMTLIFGSIGYILFNQSYEVLLLSNSVFTSIALILLFIISVFILLKIKHPFMQRVITFFKCIPLKIHFKTVLFSGVRYGIFSFQYYYILLLFGVEISYYNAIIIISTMYFLSSIVPTFFVFDAMVKGGIAIYLFGVINISELAVLSTAMLMWLLNFVLPTFFGSVFVLTYKSHHLRRTKIDIQY